MLKKYFRLAFLNLIVIVLYFFISCSEKNTTEPEKEKEVKYTQNAIKFVRR